ncbi:MAG: hypothetical protein V1765_00910 [bacterium]
MFLFRFLMLLSDIGLFVLGLAFIITGYEPWTGELWYYIIGIIIIIAVQQLLYFRQVAKDILSIFRYNYILMLTYSLILVILPILTQLIISTMIIESSSIMGDPWHRSVYYVSSPAASYVQIGCCVLAILFIILRQRHCKKIMN